MPSSFHGRGRRASLARFATARVNTLRSRESLRSRRIAVAEIAFLTLPERGALERAGAKARGGAGGEPMARRPRGSWATPLLWNEPTVSGTG